MCCENPYADIWGNHFLIDAIRVLYYNTLTSAKNCAECECSWNVNISRDECLNISDFGI